MRFSVLLPTRNGGRFLRNCIASVLDQPYDDLELVVSDNANTDETQLVVRSFASDPRLKYIRSQDAVSVTDNWRAALDASQGDYVLMIGDDDCLLPGYFERMAHVIDRYDQPDCIVYNAYSFVFPGAIDGNRSSYYAAPHFTFDRSFREGILAPEIRFAIVRDMYRFRLRYPLNMQMTLVSRRAADRIPGGMFKPPFPDHYALNALLLEADTFVYCPEKLVVVGVSPKSFGHFAYSDQQAQGLNYLGSDSSFDGRLPGNELINSMYLWLRQLKMNYPDRLGSIPISRSAYLRHQLFAWYMQLRFAGITRRQFFARCRRLGVGDWARLSLTLFDRTSLARLRKLLARGKGGARGTENVQTKWANLIALNEVNDIREFAAIVSSAGARGELSVAGVVSQESMGT